MGSFKEVLADEKKKSIFSHLILTLALEHGINSSNFSHTNLNAFELAINVIDDIELDTDEISDIIILSEDKLKYLGKEIITPIIDLIEKINDNLGDNTSKLIFTKIRTIKLTEPLIQLQSFILHNLELMQYIQAIYYEKLF